MVNIRVARDEDIEPAKRVGLRYASETIVGTLTDDEWWTLARGCMTDGVALVAEVDGRIIGIIAGKFIRMSIGKILEEVIWYVEPEERGAGLRMFDMFQKAGADASCNMIAMVAYKNDSFSLVEKVYLRAGFVELERRYIKKI